MLWTDDIRVVVGLGKGFSFCHVSDDNCDIRTNYEWPGEEGPYRTNTVLQYDDDFENVKSWGHNALYLKPKRNKFNNDGRKRIVELFKLYLGNCSDKLKPKLPEPLTYKKAIADYLREMGKLIKETISKIWAGINFTENVLLVLTVPAEYSVTDKAIMRECIFNAGLISEKNSERLQFTTESEAVAIYCFCSGLREHILTKPGTNYMIVECADNTVEITTRKLLEENQLGEVTERTGDFCGSTFIDKKFIELLEREVGKSAVDLFSEKYYDQLQYLVQKFRQDVTLLFTGKNPDFSYEFDLANFTPALLRYATSPEKDLTEEKDWVIELDFNTVKSMFDPIIDRIIGMIHVQLNNSSGECSAIFLAGDFSQSKYLLKRVREEFGQSVENISVPNLSLAAVSRGATLYGKSLYESRNLKNMNNSKCVIVTRVLKYTFGIKVSPLCEYGDPLDRLTSDGRIHKFLRIVERKTEVTIGQEFIVENLIPICPDQTQMSFEIYYTNEQNAVYCDEPGMKLLGKLFINLPDEHLEINRSCLFYLSFGDMEIKARAFNQMNGQNYQTMFELDDY
ncbi:hypothetical protein RclHR1_00260027 [Rhizophagus clarus]|uniref:Actin-like ATPase domain-containing protein n=1 Tax=Rhizophagus clarus TaxID=94130 RepID=A0A2Z6R4F2_9GLOM|nr:hypothetical protein RclHR1_00260027 [Rhizophagus clarus]